MQRKLVLQSSCIWNERNLSCKIVKKLQNYRFKKGKERTNSVGGLYIKKSKQTKQNSHTGIVLSSSDLMYKKYI